MPACSDLHSICSIFGFSQLRYFPPFLKAAQYPMLFFTQSNDFLQPMGTTALPFPCLPSLQFLAISPVCHEHYSTHQSPPTQTPHLALFRSLVLIIWSSPNVFLFFNFISLTLDSGCDCDGDADVMFGFHKSDRSFFQEVWIGPDDHRRLSPPSNSFVNFPSCDDHLARSGVGLVF